MNDVLLRTAARLLLPLMLLFSLYLLTHGHDAPGGGFVGGLVASGGLALTAVAYDAALVRRLLRADARSWAAAGFSLALASGLFGLGEAFLAGRWVTVPLGPLGELSLGTPLLFDAGVYVLVIGATSTLALTLLEED